MWPELYDFWLWMYKVLSGLEVGCSCLGFHISSWAVLLTLVTSIRCEVRKEVTPQGKALEPMLVCISSDSRAQVQGRSHSSLQPRSRASQRDPPWPMGTLKNQMCDHEGPRATSCKLKVHLLQPGFKIPTQSLTGDTLTLTHNYDEAKQDWHSNHKGA